MNSTYSPQNNAAVIKQKQVMKSVSVFFELKLQVGRVTSGNIVLIKSITCNSLKLWEA